MLLGQNEYMRLNSLVFCQDNIKHLRLAQCKLLSERKNMTTEARGGVAVSSIGENNMSIPRNFSTRGEIRFGALEPLSASIVLAEAESIISQAQTNPLSEEGILAEANYWLGIPQTKTVEKLLPRPVLNPAEVIQEQAAQNVEGRSLLPAQSLLMLVAARTFLSIPLEIITVLKPETAQISDIQTGTYLKPESRLAYIQSQAVPTSEAPQVDEGEEKLVVTQKHTKQEKISEESKRLKLRFLKDGPTLKKRISEVREVFNMAKIEAKILGFGEKVKGFLIAKFMRPNPENTSQIVQPDGPDGSYEQTRDEIKIGTFNSEAEVVDIVLKNNPVKEGIEGELATDQEVAKVIKYIGIKPQPVIEVVTRIVKKQEQPVQLVPAVIVQKVEENTIEDLGLSEVFPKAA